MNYHREDYNVGFRFFYRLSISLSVFENLLVSRGYFISNAYHQFKKFRLKSNTFNKKEKH